VALVQHRTEETSSSAVRDRQRDLGEHLQRHEACGRWCPAIPASARW